MDQTTTTAAEGRLPPVDSSVWDREQTRLASGATSALARARHFQVSLEAYLAWAYPGREPAPPVVVEGPHTHRFARRRRPEAEERARQAIALLTEHPKQSYRAIGARVGLSHEAVRRIDCGIDWPDLPRLSPPRESLTLRAALERRRAS